MKRRLPVVVLVPLLGVSLWFNWQHFHNRGGGLPGGNGAVSGSGEPEINAGPAVSVTVRPAAHGREEEAGEAEPRVSLPEIDFTGTGLADGVWRLPESPHDTETGGRIPDEKIPARENGGGEMPAAPFAVPSGSGMEIGEEIRLVPEERERSGP